MLFRQRTHRDPSRKHQKKSSGPRRISPVGWTCSQQTSLQRNQRSLSYKLILSSGQSLRSCRCVGLQIKAPRLMFMQKKKKTEEAIGVSRCLPGGTHPHKSFQFPEGLSRNQATEAIKWPFNFQPCIWAPPPQLFIMPAKLYGTIFISMSLGTNKLNLNASPDTLYRLRYPSKNSTFQSLKSPLL